MIRRLALFDLDDTLVDHTERFRSWAMGFAKERALGDGSYEWILKAASKMRGDELLLTAIREHFFLTDALEDLYADFVRQISDLIRPRPEVLAGLDKLRVDGWAVGIVTNGTQDMQWATMSAADLPDHLDSWAISGSVGAAKPDVLLFETVAQRCGVPLTAGGWMVGNNPHSDIAGGHAAGLRTIWVRNGATWPVESHPPDRVVDDVTEAFDLIH